VAIFTLADAASPHVSQADEAYCIGDGTDPRGYLDIDAIVAIAKKSHATMVAPGYGFLSENAVSLLLRSSRASCSVNRPDRAQAFATACEDNGLVFLGPTPYQIKSMGLKHEARAIALKAGVPVVPGSDGVVNDLEEAARLAKTIGYPVMVKASGGGGGMGMQVCKGEIGVSEHG
jgi:urea carboxylase